MYHCLPPSHMPLLPWLPHPTSPCLNSICPAPQQVWWEGDQCFYPGLVALFDPVATE